MKTVVAWHCNVRCSGNRAWLCTWYNRGAVQSSACVRQQKRHVCMNVHVVVCRMNCANTPSAWVAEIVDVASPAVACFQQAVQVMCVRACSWAGVWGTCPAGHCQSRSSCIYAAAGTATVQLRNHTRAGVCCSIDGTRSLHHQYAGNHCSHTCGLWDTGWTAWSP